MEENVKQMNPPYARGQEEEEMPRESEARGREGGAIDGRLQSLRQEIEGSAQVVEQLQEEKLMLEEDLLSLEVK